MEQENKPQTIQQVCTIRIAFPVVSDDESIAYKKKINELLSDIPQVRFEFNLSNMSR